MRKRDLEFLQNLIRLGSVSETARVMHTTQSNASKMLRKLENHFGFQLVERMNGRLYPTEEGRLIAEQAEASLISLRQLESRARNLREMGKYLYSVARDDIPAPDVSAPKTILNKLSDHLHRLLFVCPLNFHFDLSPFWRSQ